MLSTLLSKIPLKYINSTIISIYIKFDNFYIESNNDIDNKNILKYEHPIFK